MFFVNECTQARTRNGKQKRGVEKIYFLELSHFKKKKNAEKLWMWTINKNVNHTRKKKGQGLSKTHFSSPPSISDFCEISFFAQ